MVRHNNMISTGHFHKNWQSRVKMWFNQPMKKRQRKVIRCKKMFRLAPKPIQLLRPLVHCPSVRYNRKVRIGRGFTLMELKKVGWNPPLAKSLGVTVDHRRHNRSYNSLSDNIQRLKEYQSRLILCPKNRNQKILKTCNGADLNALDLVKLKPTSSSLKSINKKIQQYDDIKKHLLTFQREKKKAKRAALKGELV